MTSQIRDDRMKARDGTVVLFESQNEEITGARDWHGSPIKLFSGDWGVALEPIRHGPLRARELPTKGSVVTVQVRTRRGKRWTTKVRVLGFSTARSGFAVCENT